MRILILIGTPMIALWLGCGNATSSIEVSPPPPQARMPRETFEPLSSFVEMGAADTQQHIVAGVDHDELSGNWRARPGATLRFLVLPLDEIRFGLNFTLPPGSASPRNPVTIGVKLDGQPFVKKVFEDAGAHSIDEAVPKGRLTWEHETLVEIGIESPAGRPLVQPNLRTISAGFRP